LTSAARQPSPTTVAVQSDPMVRPILSVRNLVTEFETRRGRLRAVRDISFDLYPGETLGIVGESGSGKSVAMASILGLLPRGGRVVEGEVRFRGRNLVGLPRSELRKILGKEISTIFQDPMSSLNPVLTIGAQIKESLQLHQPELDRAAVLARILELLSLVGIPNPASVVNDYPHQYSGGMRQRAMIAMALANNPSVLIADEPTTALDVTIQAQVLDVFRRAKEEIDASAIMITHDFGVIAETADRVIVMYAGQVVEAGHVEEVFEHPRHPYTYGLLSSLPRLDRQSSLTQIEGMPPNMFRLPSGCAFHPRCFHRQGRDQCIEEAPALRRVEEHKLAACHFSDEKFDLDGAAGPDGKAQAPAKSNAADAPAAAPGDGRDAPEVLRVEGLKVHFPIRRGILKRQVGAIRAVDGVDLVLRKAETLALVGESGCGKTTTARAIVCLTKPDAGRIVFNGEDITAFNRDRLRAVRRDLQIVFQDPFSSLNPRMTVGELVGEPLQIHGLASTEGRARRVSELLGFVGLEGDVIDRYPHEFSGGQRQRISIARALILDPEVLVLDEPVSALDVSVQAQVINLLQRIQRELGIAFIFVSHDLAVVRQIADRIAVMYLGRIVEIGTPEEIYERPSHPYTQALLSAVPMAGAESRERYASRIVLEGDVPNPAKPPSGCRFRTRCFKAQDFCAQEDPALAVRGVGQNLTACHFAEPRDVLGLTSQPIGKTQKQRAMP
jgi:peptide/nickel transport system ATP-binding protein